MLEALNFACQRHLKEGSYYVKEHKDREKKWRTPQVDIADKVK